MTAKVTPITHDKFPFSYELCSCGCGMYRIVDLRGDLVAMTAHQDSQGKAEQIIQACNSHEALVAICQQAANIGNLIMDRASLRNQAREVLAQIDAGTKYPPSLDQPEIG